MHVDKQRSFPAQDETRDLHLHAVCASQTQLHPTMTCMHPHQSRGPSPSSPQPWNGANSSWLVGRHARPSRMQMLHDGRNATSEGPVDRTFVAPAASACFGGCEERMRHVLRRCRRGEDVDVRGRYTWIHVRCAAEMDISGSQRCRCILRGRGRGRDDVQIQARRRGGASSACEGDTRARNHGTNHTAVVASRERTTRRSKSTLTSAGACSIRVRNARKRHHAIVLRCRMPAAWCTWRSETTMDKDCSG
mmetsp:Transcript_6782/g.41388  ORF Transcript_6782/g.41388 Transcript_6782/m.41388 type:complete len:249 (+) Transcript_6782:3105-3851(+)